MVELQIVILAVAGSSPVGHPISSFGGKGRVNGGAILEAGKESDWAFAI